VKMAKLEYVVIQRIIYIRFVFTSAFFATATASII